MDRMKIKNSAPLSTTLPAEKVEKIAAQCGVLVSLLESRLSAKRKWVNDFEVEGEPGKVESFIRHIRDVELS